MVEWVIGKGLQQLSKNVMPTELVTFASSQQAAFEVETTAAERKNTGHYGTPAVVANYMAGLFPRIPSEPIRVLDPGAGVGSLSAAVCERMLEQGEPRQLEFEVWENDPKLERRLHATMNACQKALQRAGHTMTYSVRTEDFILSNTQKTLFDDGPQESFHLAILNPPYFKLRKDSPHARAMNHLVHGQPNIYSCFMAATADLLLPGGQMVAITPRSYFNGSYFKRFRCWFLERMAARHIHVFESRTETFRDNAVLQENVILRAEKRGTPKSIVLTSSYGREFTQLERCESPYDKVVDNSTGDHIIRVTVNSTEREVMNTLDSLPQRFSDLGYEISTGPVVAFRAKEFLRENKASDTAPLLWMHNVRPFITRFPPQNGKPTHIAVSDASKKLLVPAKRYVLLKRFTSKEEAKRLVAGIVQADDSYSEWIGLENHLNYVYRPGEDLDITETVGLAAYFNSTLVDRYFRAISGNTQVNAREIRNMPAPSLETLRRIGEQIRPSSEPEARCVEGVVGRELKLPSRLVEQLCKVNNE